MDVHLDKRKNPPHPRRDIVLLTDPFFWDKVRRLVGRADSSGVLEVKRRRLPFDTITLLYYLLISDTTEIVHSAVSRNPTYEGGPQYSVNWWIVRSEDRNEITLREDRGAHTEGKSFQ